MAQFPLLSGYKWLVTATSRRVWNDGEVTDSPVSLPFVSLASATAWISGVRDRDFRDTLGRRFYLGIKAHRC